MLNKDVAILQRKFKEKLLIRDNILTLLSSAVRENDVAKPSVDARRLTDHKIAPQKRVLEEDFAIKFPSSKACAMQKRCSTFDSDQEEHDFRLALKVQQEKIESPVSTFSRSSAMMPSKESLPTKTTKTSVH